MNKRPREIGNSEEFIYCACQCGYTLAKYDLYWRPRKFIHGHNRRGKLHHNYKGGWIDKHGYKRVPAPYKYPNSYYSKIAGWVLEHRLVMEKHLGRYLSGDELVHHKNGNKLDNRIENLELTTKFLHPMIHKQIRDKSRK